MKPAGAMTAVMTAWSGSDGPFTVVNMDGKTVYRALDNGNGTYSAFMYFRLPDGVTFARGATLYLDVDFKDDGGPGRFGVQYNSESDPNQRTGWALGSAVKDTQEYKTAVFRLLDTDLRGAANGGSDLRLTQPGPLQLNVVQVRISDQPTPAFIEQTKLFRPYTGPAYAGGTAVDSSTIIGKTIIGYQGWFRSPNDEDLTGWQHYIPDWGGAISPAKIAIDAWPDMTEFTDAERCAATGFTYPDGSQAGLFSSDNYRTVLRHFQWMEAYGIDGVALQRNVDDLRNPDVLSLKNAAYIRQAANLTGRTFYVEYALPIPTTAADLQPLANDWKYLVDEVGMTSDSRYLHQDGKPVVGVYGFFQSQIDSAATANAVLDIFQKSGAYQAFVAGAGYWPWRTGFDAAWKSVVYRMGSWQPWNTGNGGGPDTPPSTNYWAADKADLDAHGVIYQPEMYPGGSEDNRSGFPPGTSRQGRMKGAFLWSQFVAAHGIGAQTAFVGMFDELDEGTEIFKVTDTPPVQAYFLDNEGMPSDCHLTITGAGTAMLRGERPFSATTPDCSALTEPTVPDPIAPLTGAVLADASVTYSWTTALALAYGGTIDHYELWLDDKVSRVAATETTLPTSDGLHVWRARAVNSLNNPGGWSIAQTFRVGMCPDGGCGGFGNVGGGSSIAGAVGAAGTTAAPSDNSANRCVCSSPGAARGNCAAAALAFGIGVGAAVRRRRGHGRASG